MNIILVSVIFAFLILLYFFIGRKISAWTTISRLGFKTETPLLFLKYPKIYHLVPIILFLIAVTFLAFTGVITFVIGFTVLLFVSFVIAISGRKGGVKIYKNVLIEMLEEDKSLTDEDRQHIAQQLDKSDTELLNGAPLFY